MAHFIIEYSANIEERLDLDTLMVKVRDAAVATGVFPLGGIRVRAARRDHYVVADGHSDNGFIHCIARIGAGRPLERRRRAGEALFEVICTHLTALYEDNPLAISFEMQEIDPDLSFKKNNLHERLSQA